MSTKNTFIILIVLVAIGLVAYWGTKSDTPYQPKDNTETKEDIAPEGATLEERIISIVLKRGGLEKDEIEILSKEKVDWPNSCLGAEVDDELCAQVITPGYRVMVRTPYENLIFHTDNDGGEIRVGS